MQPMDEAGPAASSPTPPRNRVSPRKLLLSKWTAAVPQRREKHFLVVRVVEPEPPQLRIEQVELQAVHSGRLFVMPWRDLTDRKHWLQGWL